MQNRFTQKAQNALNFSLEFASEMGHTYIGSEHLLLGLCKEETGVASHYLRQRGVVIDKLKSAVIQLAGAGTPSAVSAGDMTPRTKSIIQNSLYEAKKHGQEDIGTEHLLLALLNEQAPNDQVVKLKAIQAMEKVADGKAPKIIIPSELQGLAGLAASAKTVFDTKDPE